MRATLYFYGAAYLMLGVWQAFAPASFAAQPFADFPPFNAHFVRDVSSYYPAAGLVLLVIARDVDPRRHGLALLLVVAQGVFHTLN